MASVPDHPDEHFRQIDGADMKAWEDEQIMALFGPRTMRERMAYYWRVAKSEVSQPELWVALACVVAVLIVQTYA